MKQMGYAIGGDVMNVVNTSVLGADSILGVKYVLSSYDIPGLKKLENIEPGNGKSVYYNPYALPVAFTYGHLICYRIQRKRMSSCTRISYLVICQDKMYR